MKINWDRFFRFQRGDLKFAGVMCCLLGIGAFFIKITEPKIRNKTDLVYINGELLNYYFEDGSRGYHHYIFRLKGYSNPFQIIADFMYNFDKSSFKQLQEGDSLTLSICKEDIGKLNTTNSDLRVYSLSSSNLSLLDFSKTVKIHNSNLSYWAGLFFLLWGLIMLYFGYKNKARKNL